MHRMSALLFVCLLSVGVFADEAGSDCSSEIAKTQARDSQIKTLEVQLKEEKTGSTKAEQQLSALKSSSQKAEADLKQHVKELKDSKANSKQLEKGFDDLKSSSQKTESDLRVQIKELSNKLESAEKSNEHIKELTSKLESAEKSKDDVDSALQQCGQHQQISVMGLAAKVGSMTNGVVQHALQQTDMDEKLMSKVVANVGNAKGAAGKVASNIKDRVASVDYAGIVERVSSSEAYQKMSEKIAEKTKTVRPHFDKASAQLQPAFVKAKDLMGPAFAKAQPQMEKVKSKAMEGYVAAAEAVQTHVLPVIKRGGSSARDQASAAGLAQLDKLMTPVFAVIVQAVPEHEKTLPEHPVDRALFLVALLVLANYALYFFRVSLRIALRLTSKTSWMSLKLFRLIVMIPLRLVLYLVDILFWFATLFYCCGLCRKKKKATKLAAKAQKQEKKNGEADKKAETVTVAECQALLEASKKKDRLEDGAQALAKSVKDQKPLKASTVQGKILTKEVFLQACKKCGVNIKKLNL